MTRHEHRSGRDIDITVWPEDPIGYGAGQVRYRFQWTFPIVLSPHDPNVLYATGNVAFRSRDGGQSFEAISPDLTRAVPETMEPSGGPITKDNVSTETYATIFAFAESPLQAGMFWAGTDDGLVHLTQDNGATWQAVTPQALGEWSRVSIIEASRHDAQTAYLAANRYQLDDPRPYLFKTKDGGRTWTAISEGLPSDEYTRVIREDPEVPGLLYAGTERGAYVSFDDGAHWQPLKLNMPLVPVHDLQVKGTDLVAATHGRSFWVLDDVTPLRQLARDAEAGALRLFAPRDTVRTTASSHGFDRAPDNVVKPTIMGDHYVAAVLDTGDAPIFADAGQNLPPGVILQYYLAAKAEEPVQITIRDAQGRTAATFPAEPAKKGEPKPLPADAGSHRRIWDMCYPGATKIEDAKTDWPRCAPLAPPGDYEVELKVGDKAQTKRFRLLPPPNVDIPQEDYEEQFAFLCKVRDLVDSIHTAVNRIGRLDAQLADWESRVAGTERESEVLAQAKALRDDLRAVRELLIQDKIDNFQDTINFPPRLGYRVAHIFSVAASADARPTRQSYEAFADLEAEATSVLGRLDALLEGDIARFNARVHELDLPALTA
jgi:hypothetical protein